MIKRLVSQSFVALLLIAFSTCAAIAAENSSGNKGVIMRKQPAQEVAPKDVPAPSPAPREESKPKRVETPAQPMPHEQRSPKPIVVQPEPKGPDVVQPDANDPEPRPAAPTNWPAALNNYFHAKLDNPTTDAALAAIVAHVNRGTVLGRQPDQEAERFSTWSKEWRKSAPRSESDIRIVEGFHKNVTAWVSLESQFTVQPDRDLLKQLVRVVQSQASLDPQYDDIRKQKIVNTIEQQGLFVPSGILFGYSVLPYRAVVLPKGYVPFESPTKPEFADTTSRAEAIYDFIEAPGPIFRVDYDTIGAARVVVEQSADGKQFQLVQEWKSSGAGGVQGPAILAKPFRARYMRVAVESQKETAVLRNPRVFALKEPPAAISTLEAEAPVLDGSFKETPWPRKAQVDGFINPDTEEFAEAQTTVRVCHTADALYIAVYAREPRMNTMAGTMSDRDAPLWQEESFAIVLQPTGKPEYRFVVNPIGAQFDSRDGNEEWNGEWNVSTKTWPVGWSAEIEIPFASLGADPGKDDWEIDFVRTRRNVENERSVWVYSGDGTKVRGLLIF